MDLIDAIMAGRNAVEEEAVVFGVDPAPPAPPETYTPCMLPDEEEEIKREEEEDDIAGINDDGYTCEMCRIGDSQITGDTPLLLEAVYNLYPAMSESYPEDMIFDFQAKRWNSTLYRVDKALNHRLRIKKISKAEVRHHMRNDVPKNQSKRRIERRLQFLDRSLTQIEQNGYWEKVTRGGAAGGPRKLEISGRYHNYHKTLLKSFVDLEKLKMAVRLSEEKGKSSVVSSINNFIKTKGKSDYF